MYLAQLKNWASGTALLRVRSFWVRLKQILKEVLTQSVAFCQFVALVTLAKPDTM